MNDPSTPAFYIREIPVFGNLILAPMDGISDLPFRSLARRLGSAMSYTEFINARDVIEGNPHLSRRVSYEEFERPVVFQIFDDDPDRMVEAALRLEKYNPDIFDVNLGCSARTVTNRGAGAALLRDPRKVEKIINKLSNAVSRPVTAKMRIGWDHDSLNHIEVAKIIESNGGQLIAVHGRTKQQAYNGTADWQAIAEVVNAVKIPVVANGDVRTLRDIDQIFEKTGCDAAMIGRAAIANPWIFSRLEITDIPTNEIVDTMINFFHSMLKYYGTDRGVLLFRKYIKRVLLSLNVPAASIKELITLTDAPTVLSQMGKILSLQIN